MNKFKFLDKIWVVWILEKYKIYCNKMNQINKILTVAYKWNLIINKYNNYNNNKFKFKIIVKLCKKILINKLYKILRILLIIKLINNKEI